VSDKSKIEATDVFQFMGLVLLGIGLFFWHGLGVALSVDGALLFLVGFLPGFVPALMPKAKK